MTPERWHRIKRICSTVLEGHEQGRAEDISTLCDGDADLERDVLSLIACTGRAADLFEHPAVGMPAAILALESAVPSVSLGPGTRIGSYRVIDEIGRGGMGTVYLAERADDEYHQRVALKLADVHSTAVARWFREERQILASLEHPNIARLLDGGTTPEGVPYLVMEYVDGRPIDEYCRAHALTVDERLAMFRLVCSAVDLAHRHLVVHRDIKPRNILVADGVPKLLDFGIATFVGGPADLPAGGMPMGDAPQRMTPLFASPEQMNGGPITTATDVYALGVLLYLLLARVAPYQVTRGDAGELARTIGDREPLPPSAVAASAAERRRLAGDLDAIVLKAMRKSAIERYPSASALVADLDRFLASRPVEARGNGLAYLTTKALRRHLAAVVTSALVLAALITGLGVAVWQRQQTEMERRRAQRHFDNARQLASSLIFEVHDGIESLPGSVPARQLLISRAIEYFDGLASEERGNLSLQRELAAAYDRLGGVLGRPFRSNLGDTRAAVDSYRKALAIRQMLAQAYPDDRPTQLELWSSYHRLADTLRETHSTREALEFGDQAHAMSALLQRHWPDDPGVRRAAAQTEILRQRAFLQSGAIDDLKRSIDTALGLEAVFLTAQPTNQDVREEMAGLYGRMAIALLKLGQPAAALPYAQRRVSMASDEPDAEDRHRIQARRTRSSALLQLAQVLARVGDPVGAARAQREALDLRRDLAARDPSDRQSVIDVLNAQLEIGGLLLRAREFRAAEAPLREAVMLGERLAAADPDHVFIRLSLLSSLVRLSTALLALNPGSGDAAQLVQRAIDIARASSAADPEDVRFKFELAQAYALEGDVLSQTSWYQQSLAILSELRESGRLAGGTLNGDEPARLEEIARKLASKP